MIICVDLTVNLNYSNILICAYKRRDRERLNEASICKKKQQEQLLQTFNSNEFVEFVIALKLSLSLFLSLAQPYN